MAYFGYREIGCCCFKRSKWKRSHSIDQQQSQFQKLESRNSGVCIIKTDKDSLEIINDLKFIIF